MDFMQPSGLPWCPLNFSTGGLISLKRTLYAHHFQWKRRERGFFRSFYRGNRGNLQTPRQQFERGQHALDDGEVVIVAALLLDQVVAEGENADAIDLKGAGKEGQTEQARRATGGCPCHCRLSFRKKLARRRISNSGHGPKARGKPLFDVAAPASGAFHTRIEQFRVVGVEGDNRGDIVRIERLNPAIDDATVMFVFLQGGVLPYVFRILSRIIYYTFSGTNSKASERGAKR